MKIGRLFRLGRSAVLTLSLLALAACGGGSSSGGSGGGGGGPVAPSGLSYTSPTQATVGVALAALSPTVTGTVTSYTVSPALPAGLTLNATSGVISGTPTAATAAASYTITAGNSAGNTTFALGLTVNPPAPSALSYTSPVQATVGTAITPLSPTVTGTVSSYAVTPALPAGLALNATSGVISGTPTATAAQATYTVTASNAGGSTAAGVILTVSASARVSGVAAAGAPMAGATVTLKDAAGNSVTGITAADGSFSLNVAGLTPPFLLSVAGSSTLYGYAAGTGTANLTPYSTVTLQSYYAAQGSTLGAVFAGTLNATSFPSAAQLALLLQPFVSVLQPYLANASVPQPASFNPFTVTFTANHTGFDLILDRTVLAAGALSLTVDNGSGTTAGTLTSVVTIQVTPGSASALATVAVNSTTSNATTATSSSSQQNVPVGTTPAQQSALASAESGILTMFSNLAQLVASKGSALAASDITPYVDSSYLDQGQNAAAFAATFASNFGAIPAGTTMAASFLRLNAFNAANQTLDASIRLTFSNSTGSSDSYWQTFDNPGVGLVFRQQAGGNWAFYGQQTSFPAQVRVGMGRNYDANSGTPDTASTALNMQAQVTVAPGALTAASIAGPSASLPNCTQSPSPLNQSSVTLVHDAGLSNGKDTYDLCTTVSVALSGNPPAAGTIYTFSLTRASDGSIAQQTYPLNGATRDDGDITQINGVTRSAFAAAHAVAAVAGTTLTISYSPPTTFPVLYSFLTGYCQNASQRVSGGGSSIQGTAGNIPPGTWSGTIAIPTQCSGAAPAGLNISVNFVGLNGESASVSQALHL
jgi:hypothetical protein